MSKRILKVNELLKKEVGQLFLREVEFPKDVLVTITRVETSSDLSSAIVSVSVMPSSASKVVKKILKYSLYGLQQEINKRLKMRPIPKIIFKEEEKVSKAARIEELLEKMKTDKNQF